MNLKSLFKRELTSYLYIKKLINSNVKIGKNCRFFDPKNIIIDTQNPHMIELGDNVYMTSGVKILTHDYSWVILSGIYGKILGGVGKVKIGSNVFIGMNTVILKNTTIGNNVIIGAGSIISGKVDSNSVYAGNPAKKIMTIEEFYTKKNQISLDSAKQIFEEYYKRYNVFPPRKVFYEYISLFVNKIQDLTIEEKKLIERTGYSEIIYSDILKNNSIFKNYEEFINYISK